ncbi:reverse gyrase [Venenivibrio stagnispumantis]|uniref:Reverse gyrase n=1 Tax=Venenivibrio stagnispumantis TaxID=407998 RepID=A0AA46AE42_9AQUI|nr:reverse gyrase [Venenivibrio stagnispumantis]MCW4573844.1 reverse gyrase [Venenivibrio stagnispumantis]SMP10166.1 Reverse gyrase [Venenivibrio stagnispumantis]
MIPIIYKNMCPNCGGDISSERLQKGILCEKCLPEEIPHEEICDFLGYGQFKKICDLWEEVDKFKKFFENILKNSLWSIQETWAIRYFLGISHALLAPTGIGKTTFGLILSKYLVENKNGKVYLVFPTQILVEQAYDRLVKFGVNPDVIIPYCQKFAKTKKKQEEFKEKIQNADFNILITTSMFLYKNIDIIPKSIYDFIFIDDVDSILKSAKNIDKVLMLLGFDEKDIEETMKFLSYKAKIFSKPNPSDEELEIYKNWQRKIENISKKRKGVLIVSSATSNPKSRRVLLFRELLGFEVGRPSLTLRNIEDIYEDSKDLWKDSIQKIKELGNGGLVFLSSSETKEKLEEYIQFLKDNGIDAIHYEEFWERLEDYKQGKAPVAVGFASYRNPLARGVDLPDTIRYALFLGVPKLVFNISIEEKFSHLYYFLLIITPFLTKNKLITPDITQKLYNYINFLKIYAFFDEEKLDENKLNKLREIQNFALSLLNNKDIFNAIKNSPEITLKEENGQFILITADVSGYIQASGRTSRLYPGGLTKGISYILKDDEKAFYSLTKKVRWFNEDITFKHISEINLEEILKKVDEDREKVKKILAGEIIPEERKRFITTLVIVESPNKARTIATFFGKPLRRKLKDIDAYEIGVGDRFLTIVATKGHIFDLNKELYYFGVKKDKNIFIPIFEPIVEDEERGETKKDIIESIRELDLEVENIFVATDPDTEGEKIAYDIYLNSKIFNTDIKRAEFHEVTKRAFLEAINNPRNFDENLVKAQLIRRIADRWVGFTISQYVQEKLNKSWLSAGRVQTPVLEWIIKRAEEASKKVVVVIIYLNDTPVEFIFEDKNQGKYFFEKLEYVIIEEEKKEEEKLFETPFSTDKMLKEAAAVLKFSPQKTMELAQDLFESGLITYHRTDSIRVSPVGISVAKEYISENYGEQFFSAKTFSTAGGAHECIRPTKPIDAEELKSTIFTMNLTGITKDHIKLYDLIFRQFIASQMKEVLVEKTTYKVKAFDKETEISLFTKIIEDGFNLVKPIKIQTIPVGKQNVVQNKKYSLRPKVPYYTYATVIQDMKEKGIGRPSTYAVTIEKLLERKYIIERNGFLFPTKLGKTVLDLIKKREDFYKFVNENYTKELEELMDKVEKNEADYMKILQQMFKEIID